MKTTDKTIKAVIGIRTDDEILTQMDKGEYKLCMKAYAKEFKPIFDKMLTWVKDDFNKGLFIEQFEQLLHREIKQKRLTPTDKGECKLCMKAYAKEFKPIFDKTLTWVEDDFNKGLFIEQFEQFLRGEVKQNGV